MKKDISPIKSFINKRPKVCGAYGYGSGVFKQSGYSSGEKTQIDLILVVDDLKKWHLENIKLNPKDYSFIGKMFFKHASISKLKGITGITYLSNILENGKVYKYGTIEEKDLERYLKNWESFYIPGRFQKENLSIIESNKIKKLNNLNRKKALFTALLTVPEDKNKLIDIYTQLCGLSYLGDTRMKFAENPRKVLNIVEGSYDKFKEIYKTSNTYFTSDENEEISINYSKLLDNIHELPDALLKYINNEVETGDLTLIREKIIEYFTTLNKKESTNQTIKGICTNGIVRSIKYASSKVMKKLKN